MMIWETGETNRRIAGKHHHGCNDGSALLQWFVANSTDGNPNGIAPGSGIRSNHWYSGRSAFRIMFQIG